jgi:hypothetical protein
MSLKAVVLSPDMAGAWYRLRAAYPKRTGPDPTSLAKAIFADLVKIGEDAEGLIAAAARYTATKPDPKFVPQLKTWLRQRRFEDYGPEAEPAPAIALDADHHPFRGLVDRVGIGRWATWFKPLRLERDGELSVVIAPSKFHADRVRADFGTVLSDILGEMEIRP